MDLLKQVQGGLVTVWQKVTTAGRDDRGGAMGQIPAMSRDELSLTRKAQSEMLKGRVDTISFNKDMRPKEIQAVENELLNITITARGLGFKDVEQSAQEKLSAIEKLSANPYLEVVDNLRYDSSKSPDNNAGRKKQLETLLRVLRRLEDKDAVEAAERELKRYESAPKSSNP
jgi:hypothetical protein